MLTLIIAGLLAHAAEPAPSESTWRAGAAMRDITGPIVDHAMMGFGEADLKNLGMHTRLYARAFVVDDGERQLALVTADLGFISPWLHQQVVAQLEERLGCGFSPQELLLAATHTHAGPGGYDVHTLYQLATDGYSAPLTRLIATGIADAVEAAWIAREPAHLSWVAGELTDASVNQSREAWLQNPESAAGPDRNTRMTQLRLDGPHSRIGALSWFAVHPTTLGKENRLVSGDNKGVAALRVEAAFPGLVAAFPNADEGDISSDVFGPGDPTDPFQRTELSGRRQADRAAALLAEEGTAISGPLDVRLSWVRMPGLYVASAGTELCRAALGESFAAGSEDGPSGQAGFAEGMVRGERRERPLDVRLGLTLLRPILRGGPANTRCHEEKPILFTAGTRLGFRWTPEVLPFQLVRMGSLAIIAAPAEVTTVAGQRLRATVAARLAPLGVEEVIISGLSNGYSHYLTTAEEYALQHYEGASTLYGPHTLLAWQQIFDDLAANMVAGSTAQGRTVAPEPAPEWKERGHDCNPGPRGSVRSGYLDGPARVRCDEAATFTFASRHPKRESGWDPLRIERQLDGGWVLVTTDEAPETRLQWRKTGRDYDVEVTWQVPPETPAGTYRAVLGAVEGPAFSLSCGG